MYINVYICHKIKLENGRKQFLYMRRVKLKVKHLTSSSYCKSQSNSGISSFMRLIQHRWLKIYSGTLWLFSGISFMWFVARLHILGYTASIWGWLVYEQLERILKETAVS